MTAEILDGETRAEEQLESVEGQENLEAMVEADESEQPNDESESDEHDRISDAENHLLEIQNAAMDVRKAESEVDHRKEELKISKARYDLTVTRLTNLIEATANDEDRPLLNQNQDADSEDPDDGWKSQEIEVLWLTDPISGFGESKRIAIADEIKTLGDFLELLQKVGKDADHLADLLPKGCGKSLADELENRFHDYVANWSETVEMLEDTKIEIIINQLRSQEPDWKKNVESDEFFELGIHHWESKYSVLDASDQINESQMTQEESVQYAKGFWFHYVVSDDGAQDGAQEEYEDVPEDELLSNL